MDERQGDTTQGATMGLFGKKKKSYKLALGNTAKATYRGLSTKDKKLVDSMLDSITAAPRAGTYNKEKESWSVGMGHIVVVYTILEDRLFISVIRILVA